MTVMLVMIMTVMMMISAGCSPFYGYYRHEEPFLKIYLYSPLLVKKLVAVFRFIFRCLLLLLLAAVTVVFTCVLPVEVVNAVLCAVVSK